MNKLLYKDITDKIINAAIEVHKNLGPGLLESAYEECLFYELLKKNMLIGWWVWVFVVCGGGVIKTKYRLDLLVEDKVIVELKSVDKLLPIHEAQLITYLKLSGYRVGMLINFNVKLLKDGIIRRIV